MKQLSFDEQAAISIISSPVNNHDNSSVYDNYNFNPIDKMVELYEALVQSKKEKVEMLQKTLNEKK